MYDISIRQNKETEQIRRFTMINKIPVILASASPRRKELLEQAGISFTIMPSSAEEKPIEDTPNVIAENLAFTKANDIYQQLKKEKKDNFIVIGADTIVHYNNDILGKPEDEQEAYDMLSMLSDRTHQVYTGVCIIYKGESGKQVEIFSERTDVTFYPITSYEIKNYIETGDPLDKAGSYGIQGPFAIHIREIKGDYNNVVGLPIAKLYQTLKSMNLV